MNTDLSHEIRNVFRNGFWPQWTIHKELLRQGVPIGTAIFFDYSVITLIALLIARGEQMEAAAHSISSSVCYICYLLPLSVSTVTTTSVSNSLGKGDAQGAANISNVIMIFSSVSAVTITLLIAMASSLIASVYTGGAIAAAYARQLIILVGLYRFFDNIFTVCNDILRSYQKTVIPMLILAGAM